MRILATVLSMSLCVSQAFAGTPCATSSEQKTFAVVLLQNHLMVEALTCGKEDQYNDVVGRLRRDFLRGTVGMRAFFVRHREPTAEADRYITGMSNSAALESSRTGDAAFCSSGVQELNDAKDIRTSRDLHAYAEGRNYDSGIPTCSSGPRRRSARPG